MLVKPACLPRQAFKGGGESLLRVVSYGDYGEKRCHKVDVEVSECVETFSIYKITHFSGILQKTLPRTNLCPSVRGAMSL